MMRNKILVLGLMLVGVCMTAMAQARGNIIKYIDENKLYRNGNDVTVTNLDLQWPVALDGDGMPELQKELCKTLLDVDATTMQDGWTEFHKKLGTEIYRMPDSVTRHYINVKLQALWWEKGRYASFYLKRQETDSEGKELSATKKFITYNIADGELWNLDKVFTEYTDESNRVAFESLLDKNSVCDDADKQSIDLTQVPADFALLGGAAVMGLGGPFEHDNFSTVSVNNLYQLGFFKHGFVRWLQGKGKPKRKTESIVSPVDFDTSLSTDSVTYNITKRASYPGGNDSLVAFLRDNVKYPDVDMAMHRQGRVMLSFIVEKDGSLTDITVAEPLSPSLDSEAVRVLKLMPKWIPAESKGNKVRTYMRLPVVYRIG